MADLRRQLIGMRSRSTGEAFENMLNGSCAYYKDLGIAIIEKTPEPMRILKPYGDRRYGKFIACFQKQAQPDYKGVLCDGTAIIFEAKHTDGDRILESVITETQRQNFEGFKRLGAHCFVIVSIGFESFYRVPWKVFRSMKELYGRKYMKAEDLEPYKLAERCGTLLILDGIELLEISTYGG